MTTTDQKTILRRRIEDAIRKSPAALAVAAKALIAAGLIRPVERQKGQ